MKKFQANFYIFIILHFISNINISEAQWVQCNGPSLSINSLAISGSNIFAGTVESGVFLSTNNGINWTHSGLMSYDVRTFAVSGTNIFAGTFGNGIFLSTNNGAIWIQSGLTSDIVWSLAISGTNIFAGTMWGVLLSTNNGTNWIQSGLSSKIIWSLAISGTNIFAGTSDGFFLSTNNGTNWTQSGLMGKTIYSLAVSGTNIFAGTLVEGVFLSTNNGTNWTQSGLMNYVVQSLIISVTNIFAGTSGGVFLSTNNGSNWTQKNQGFNPIPSVYSFLILDNYIFAGTYYHFVWRRLLSDITNIQKILSENPMPYTLHQNYPNPFNALTNVKFQMLNSGFVTLKIFDVMGKEIATLMNEQKQQGIYEVRWNAADFPSGIYFYKLSAGNFTDTKRMILIK